jgi:quercetin dioxygenase-like cupin family protein
MTEEVQFLDSRARIHAASADTSGFALLEIDAPPGSQPPLHVHREEGEGWFVLDGEITLWVGDETHTLRPGQFLFAPPRIPHTLRMGERGARYLVIAPRGLRGLRAGGRRARRARPRATDSRRRRARIDILGPPGMLPAELAA